ncbi:MULTISPECIES: branched-chain amino acid transport system II carrier protein [Campylobacter]|uniref:branched-chain amino acid transport system II carrier protein n=1 Tax=Campylobacter TaxID=194 RepID=UPI00138E3A2D|nr:MULTISPECIES: branched-chain amino acid transport system II carrier protein [Campylobacter]MDV2489556.1 branched-chain amino acid transport system II carrier protein [Campylobacter sp. TJR-1]HDX6329276.1 branched-chain amino acid transport system II carrier protein [Campylobacter fetus subsp. venerealis]
MKKNLLKSDFLIISLMLFSMFFGAGNFIFPPMVGKEAGENLYEAIAFFCLTAVALPVLGIAAVAKSGTLDVLVKRVDRLFAPIFTISVYIIIGPLLAIPRAANMPYEVSLSPSFGDSLLFVYTAVYFIINYIICINKSTMIDTIGKWLAPIMLVLIFALFMASIINPLGELGEASGKYAISPMSSGFLDGYQTMDAMAALVFGIVVIQAMKSIGIKDNKRLANSVISSGILAGVILMSIYIILSYIGASSASRFPEAVNGANVLSLVTHYLFGFYGKFILGSIFLLACLTTTVGLIGSASEYFSSIVPKLSYKFWVFIWSFASFCMANIGLNDILNYSIPILTTFYPVSIVLILLALINNIINSSKLIYRSCVYLTLIISLAYSLEQIGIKLPVIVNIFKNIPFYDIGLGWVIPGIICFCVSYIIFILRKRGSF